VQPSGADGFDGSGAGARCAAQRWAEFVVNEFPDSNVIRMAEKLLRDIEGVRKSKP